MNARSLMVVVLLPAACLGLSTFDVPFEHWYAAAGRDGFRSIFTMLGSIAALVMCLIYLDTIRQGLRPTESADTSRSTDQQAA